MLTNNLLDIGSLEFQFADYAILLCDEREHVQLSYEVLFMGQLIDSNEKWRAYKAYDFEFPSSEELKHLKGVIIPGSKHGINDHQNDWLEPLKALVKRIYTDYPHIKLIGVCFGH